MDATDFREVELGRWCAHKGGDFKQDTVEGFAQCDIGDDKFIVGEDRLDFYSPDGDRSFEIDRLYFSHGELHARYSDMPYDYKYEPPEERQPFQLVER